MTIKLQEIVKQNRSVGRMIENGQPTALFEEALQSQVAMYLDKDINASRPRGKAMRNSRRNNRNNVARSLVGRLKEKGADPGELHGQAAELQQPHRDHPGRLHGHRPARRAQDHRAAADGAGARQPLNIQALQAAWRCGAGRLDGALKVEGVRCNGEPDHA